VLGGAAVVALVWMVLMAFRGRSALLAEQRAVEAQPLRKPDISALTFAPEAGRGDPEAALAAALRARDWAMAALWLYTLMLLRLDRAGVLRLAPGKTNRAYRDESRTGPAPAATALGEAVTVFERSFFGHQPVAEAEVALLRRRRAELEASLEPERAR
jgi:hypothetical protein